MIPLQEDKKRRTTFHLCRPLFVAACECRRDRGVELGTLLSSAASTSANFLVVLIVICSTCNTRRATVASAITLSIPVSSIVKEKLASVISPAIFVRPLKSGGVASGAFLRFLTSRTGTVASDPIPLRAWPILPTHDGGASCPKETLACVSCLRPARQVCCPAALRINRVISSGCEISERWLAFTSMVWAPIRLAMKRSRSGLMVRSSVETA